MYKHNISTTRRRLLVGGATIALASLAGCSGGGDNGENSGPAATSTRESTSAPGDADTSGESTSAPEDADTSGGGDGGSAAGSDSGSQTFGDAVAAEQSFAMEGTVQTDQGEATIRGRFDGGDSYWRFETGETVTEMYSVDGDSYLVSQGQCIRNAGSGPSGGFSADQIQEDRSTQSDVTPTGRDTIDGQEVLVYEFTSDEADVTYYVSVESGYPVRVETDSGTFDFSSWGDVEPIQKPDMECQDIGQPTGQ